MAYYWTVVCFLLGTVIGSFLNVVVYRVPRGESVVSPGSRCPGCGATIRWHDNIPLLSWLCLGGRCRTCSMWIPVRYPAVELLGGALFAVAGWKWGLSWTTVAAWVFGAVMIALAFIVYDHALLPDKIFLPAVAAALVATAVLDPAGWWSGVACAAGVVLLLLAVSALLRSRNAGSEYIGMAEIKVAALAAILLRFSVVLALALGVFLAVLYYVYQRLRGRTLAIRSLRPGSSLCAGAVIALLFSENILRVSTSFYY